MNKQKIKKHVAARLDQEVPELRQWIHAGVYRSCSDRFVYVKDFMPCRDFPGPVSMIIHIPIEYGLDIPPTEVILISDYVFPHFYEVKPKRIAREMIEIRKRYFTFVDSLIHFLQKRKHKYYWFCFHLCRDIKKSRDPFSLLEFVAAVQQGLKEVVVMKREERIAELREMMCCFNEVVLPRRSRQEEMVIGRVMNILRWPGDTF